MTYIDWRDYADLQMRWSDRLRRLASERTGAEAEALSRLAVAAFLNGRDALSGNPGPIVSES